MFGKDVIESRLHNFNNGSFIYDLFHTSNSTFVLHVGKVCLSGDYVLATVTKYCNNRAYVLLLQRLFNIELSFERFDAIQR